MYYRVSPSLAWFNQFFRKGTKEQGEWLTVNEIIQRMASTRSVSREINPYILSRELLREGIKKEHRVTDNYYLVQEKKLCA